MASVAEHRRQRFVCGSQQKRTIASAQQPGASLLFRNNLFVLRQHPADLLCAAALLCRAEERSRSLFGSFEVDGLCRKMVGAQSPKP